MSLLRMLGLLNRRGTPAEEAPRAAAADPEAARQRKLRLARQRLAEVFTPARPLAGTSFLLHGREGDGIFVGRRLERERIARALIDDRLHVLLYGERGLGKTSLANFVIAELQAADFMVVRHLCSADSDFDAIMRSLFQELPRLFAGPAAAFAPVTPAGSPQAGAPLPQHRLRPADIVALLAPFRRLRLVFVMDEFDRVVDEDTRTAMADLIKQCSDVRLPVSFAIIGVSGSAEQLIGSHPSIQRCLLRVPLPLLEDEDVARIAARAEFAGLACPQPLRWGIAQLARGVPYMAQLLSLRAGQAALEEGRMEMRGRDLVAAVEAALVEADPRLHGFYGRLTARERDRAALGVLRAAAAGRRDAFGRFRAVVEGGSLRIGGLRADCAAWRRLREAGGIRAASGAEPDLYAFAEPMLAPFVLHRAVIERHGATATPWNVPAGAVATP